MRQVVCSVATHGHVLLVIRKNNKRTRALQRNAIRLGVRFRIMARCELS